MAWRPRHIFGAMDGVSLSSKPQPRGAAAARDGEWINFAVRQTGDNAARLTKKVRRVLEKRFGVEIELSDARGVAIRGEADAITHAKPAVDSLLDARPSHKPPSGPRKATGVRVTTYWQPHSLEDVGLLIGRGGKTMKMIRNKSNVKSLRFENEPGRFVITGRSLDACTRAEELLYAQSTKHAAAKAARSYREALGGKDAHATPVTSSASASSIDSSSS